MQTKQFHVIPNTLFPCLPTPSPTSRPLHHQPSASWHPIIHTLTLQMSKPSQSSTPHHISNTINTIRVYDQRSILMRLLYFFRFDAPRHTSWNWRSQRSSSAVAKTTARWKTVQNFSSSLPFDEERDFTKRGVDQIWRGFWIKLYIETLVPNLKTITIFSHSAKCWLTFCWLL